MLNYTSFVRRLRLEKRKQRFKTYLRTHKGISTVYPLTGIPRLSFKRINEEND